MKQILEFMKVLLWQSKQLFIMGKGRRETRVTHPTKKRYKTPTYKYIKKENLTLLIELEFWFLSPRVFFKLKNLVFE
jgi:hypothetical protein